VEEKRGGGDEGGRRKEEGEKIEKLTIIDIVVENGGKESTEFTDSGRESMSGRTNRGGVGFGGDTRREKMKNVKIGSRMRFSQKRS